MTGRSTRGNKGLILAAALVLLILTAITAAGAEGAETPAPAGSGRVSVYGLDDGFFSWCYATGTIPDGVTPRKYATPVWLYHTEAGASDPERETRIDCQVSFSWGDGTLKDAVQIRTGEDGPEIVISSEDIRYPGEAVFRFVLEGEKLQAERYVTLRVLSWEDYPPVTLLKQEETVSLQKGETFDEARTLGGVMENRIEAIANTLRRTGAEFNADPAGKAEYALKLPEGTNEDDFTVRTVSTWYGTARDWTANAYGSYDMKAVFCFTNIQCEIPVRINVSSYSISGPRILHPGERGGYEVADQEISAGTAFTWQVEGEGVELDKEAGVVRVSEDHPPYEFTLTAVPDGDAPEVSLRVGVTDGVMRDYETTLYTSSTGFSFHVISDAEHGFRWGRTADGIGAKKENEHSGEVMFEEFRVVTLPDYREKSEDAEAYYDIHYIDSPGVITAQEDFLMDGHPARITLLEYGYSPRITYVGELCYVRNNAALTVYLKTIPGKDPVTEPPKVTLADMHLIAREIRYHESRIGVSQNDGTFMVVCKEGVSETRAGARLNYSVKFDSARVNGDAAKTAVSWSVVDAATGEHPAEAAISDKGQLTIAREINRTLNLKIIAESQTFHTRAEASLTVLPVLTRMDAEPKNLLLYLTEEDSGTVRIIMTPDAVPPVGLEWNCGKKNFVDITPLDDGAAEIRPLSAGKGTVTVTEPDGKSCQIFVTVEIPVESLELSVRGSVRPGGMLQIYPAILPKNAANKTMEWSVNVEKETAFITPQGMLKVQKDTAPGTEIQVTCKALGAREPLTAVITVTVE